MRWHKILVERSATYAIADYNKGAEQNKSQIDSQMCISQAQKNNTARKESYMKHYGRFLLWDPY